MPPQRCVSFHDWPDNFTENSYSCNCLFNSALYSQAMKTKTILVVDDERAVLTLVRGFLESVGYQVLEAENGREASLISEHHKGRPIHLLLTDVAMPGMNGHELAQRLVSCRPEMKVIYMSGDTKSSLVHDGVLKPATIVIQKPFSRDVLECKVREVLES